MKEAAQYLQNFLIRDKNGYQVTATSMSPENAFKLPNGEVHQITYAPTIDVEMVMELYQTSIQVSRRYGTIQEWIEDYEAEHGHRHISHSLAYIPAKIINEKNYASN